MKFLGDKPNYYVNLISGLRPYPSCQGTRTQFAAAAILSRLPKQIQTAEMSETAETTAATDAHHSAAEENNSQSLRYISAGSCN
jgi:hypothetical protein